MATTRKYRVAVAGGAGVWGARYLQAYAKHPDCEIVALVDTAAERRMQFAEYYGIKNEYDSIEDLLSKDTPDIVSGVLPVSAAHDVMIACAESGVKVVSCEKPISQKLSLADEMVSVCSDNGVPFGCGTAMWEVLYLHEISKWVQDGNIGELQSASLPSGLIQQVSGTGCVALNFLRFLTGMEAAWLEGWTDPEAAAHANDDCSAYGRLGMSGGIVCTIPSSDEIAEPRGAAVSLIGSAGRIWLYRGDAIIIKGTGADASPVGLEFMDRPREGRTDSFRYRIESLMQACETGRDPLCSGHDYRQVLEIAVALKLSACEGHKRIYLPLQDRDHLLKPRPWRLLGGDVAGWDEVGRTPRIYEED